MVNRHQINSLSQPAIKFFVSNPKDYQQAYWMLGMFYEQVLLEYIYYNHDYDGIYVDVGSCIGNHTMYFAFAMDKQVVSIEPNKLALDLQLFNLEENKLLGQVTHFNIGLSDEAGRANIYSSDPDDIALSTLVEGNDIEVKTLDSLGINKVALIKIDVEGMEKKVLRGAKKTIETWKPVLFVEIMKEEDILGIMEELPEGYKLTRRFNATPTYEFLYTSMEKLDG